MTDARADAATTRLRRLVPPPPPKSGWLYLFTRVGGEAIGAWQDDQASLGEQAMLLGTRMERSDGSPTDWSNEFNWTFSPTAESAGGAQGRWLNYWGAFLAVPREPGESDALYRPRILQEITRPTTNNIGMALAIDHGLGVSGTVVYDAVDFLEMLRLNEGDRLNDTIDDPVLNSSGTGASDLHACFIVQVPAIPSPYTVDTVTRIANRTKAAGTRLLEVLQLP